MLSQNNTSATQRKISKYSERSKHKTHNFKLIQFQGPTKVKIRASVNIFEDLWPADVYDTYDGLFTAPN